MLYNKINDDLKYAMKSQDSFTLGVIRMLKGAMQLEKTNQRDELSDEEIIKVVSRQVKLRKESIVEFEKAGRNDLVEQNLKEIDVLSNYLPVQLTNEEIDKTLDDVFELIKPNSIKDMGIIMKEVTPKLSGRADMSYVSKLIKDRLSNL